MLIPIPIYYARMVTKLCTYILKYFGLPQGRFSIQVSGNPGSVVVVVVVVVCLLCCRLCHALAQTCQLPVMLVLPVVLLTVVCQSSQSRK